MTPIELICITVFCAIASFFLYGCWKWENDRYNYRKKHGIDPKYHGWDLDKNDKNQDQ